MLTYYYVLQKHLYQILKVLVHPKIGAVSHRKLRVLSIRRSNSDNTKFTKPNFILSLYALQIRGVVIALLA